MTSYPRVIIIEERNPRTKKEANYKGLTYASGQQAIVFVNQRLNQDRKEFLDTLLHELYHAVVGMYGFSRKHQEQIARRVGEATRLALVKKEKHGISR